MSGKNSIDQIIKASHGLSEGIKNTVQVNVTVAAKSGQLEITPAAFQKLQALIQASVEEGFHKGHRIFTKQVEEALASSSPDAAKPKKKSP